MKRFTSFLAYLIVGATVFVCMLLFTNLTGIFSSYNFNPYYILGYLFFSLMIMLAHALRWKIILLAHQVDMGFWRLFRYRVVAFAFGYITPSMRLGGEPVRAALLNRHKIPVSKGISSVILDKSIEMASNGVFFFVGFFIVIFKFQLMLITKIFLVMSSLSATALVLVYYFQLSRGKPVLSKIFRWLRLHKIQGMIRHEQHIKDTEARMMRFLKEYRMVFNIAVLISVISWLFMFLEYKFVVLLVGINATLPELFLIITFVGISLLVPIPGALGVQEASQVSAFSILGRRSGIGIALTLIIRARDLMWTLLGLLFIQHQLNLKRLLFKNERSA